MKDTSLLFFFFLTARVVTAQISIAPTNPATSDEITLHFDATAGNQELQDCSCDVYMHTGVITTESTHSGDWKYVKAPWGSTDADILMTQVGPNLYESTFKIDEFYGIPEAVEVTQLAFVFRNTDGSLVGRSASNGDILYNINLQSPTQVVSTPVYNDGNEVIMASDEGYLSFRGYDEDIIRFKYQNNASPVTDSTLMLSRWDMSHNLTLSQEDNYTTLDAGKLRVEIQHNPVKLTWVYQEDTLVEERRPVYRQPGKSGCFLSLGANEVINGTGFRAIDMNLNGEQLEMYNRAQYGYSEGLRNANISIPFYVSNVGYGMFFNKHHRSTFDFGHSTTGEMQYQVDDDEFSYFVIGGGGYEDLLSSYHDLTGYQPLPPIWALGYIQSKYGYETEAEARNVVSSLKQNGYPIDALILDLYWFGDPGTMGNLDWDYSRFPTPAKMISDFNDQGVKTILISEPYFTENSDNFGFAASNDYLATNDAGQTYIIDDFWAGSAGLLDISLGDARNWFWDKYTPHIDMGIAGWWCDLGEPESHPAEMVHQRGEARQVHNTYSLEWAKLLYDNYQKEYTDQRLFNLIRSGYAGMQRFSTFPWSGDIQRSFDGLKVQVPIMLNMSMSGVPFMHSDLGGFVGGGKDDELYTRWMQLGTLSPVMRAHGTGIDTEPYNYGEGVQDALKKALKLRYELLPYNYNLAYTNNQTGRPLALPMHFFDPSNTHLAEAQDQYYWGEDMIVAPVLTQGSTSRSVALPSGNWMDYETGVRYQGNQEITVDAPLDKIPVFVRGGSMIPTTTGLDNTEDYLAQSLNVKYFSDQRSQITSDDYYADDGITPGAFDAQQFEMLRFTSEYISKGSINLSCAQTGPGFSGAPSERDMQFEIFNYDTIPGKAMVNGSEMPILVTKSTYDQSEYAAFWDKEHNRLYLKFSWDLLTTDIQVRPGEKEPEPSVLALKEEQIFLHPNPFTDRLNITFDVSQPFQPEMKLLDLQGREVRVHEWSTGPGTNNYSIDTHFLPAGLYFLQVEYAGEARTFRVFKK